MCRELEAIGLPDPYFNNDTFILKTTVKSAAFDHESTQNASIRSEIASIRQENASIQQENASIDEKKELMKKIDRLSHEKKNNCQRSSLCQYDY
jgi:ATP-dependent DNA helicase RecG